MDRYAAHRMVKRLARRAGITKRISPHSLRHRPAGDRARLGCQAKAAHSGADGESRHRAVERHRCLSGYSASAERR